MFKVVKRDGQIADYNISKISEAIKKAFESKEKQYHPSTIDFLALKVTADFEPKIENDLKNIELDILASSRKYSKSPRPEQNIKAEGEE